MALALLVGASGAAFAQPARQDKAAQTIEDLKRAVENSPGSALDWYGLGEALQKTGDDARALEAYDKAFETAGKSFNWLPIAATLASAHILLHQLKNDDAMKVLKRYNEEELRKMAPAWRVRILRAYGQVYAAQGRDAEAWAKFKEALAVERGQ